MKYQEIKYKFDFKNEHLVSVEDIQRIEQAMSFVWTKHVKSPVEFNIFFYKTYSINLGIEGKVSICCQYEPISDSFMFAIDTIKEKYNLGLNFTILSAHEAMHKVQWHFKRNCEFRSSFSSDEEYNNTKTEIEAWTEAMKTFRTLLPNYNYNLIVGNKVF